MFHSITVLTVIFDQINADLVSIRDFFTSFMYFIFFMIKYFIFVLNFLFFGASNVIFFLYFVSWAHLMCADSTVPYVSIWRSTFRNILMDGIRV